MKRAAVIIPNYNGKQFLETCLTSLRRQTVQDFVTVVIDNGSADGSVSYIREHFPEVRVRAFHDNTGFCHAVNAGIEMTTEPYVILLNNDTECDPAFVQRLLAAMDAQPQAFSCGACMVSMQNPAILDDAGDFYTVFGWAYARGKDQPAEHYATAGQVFSACAGAAVYRRSILEEIGLFDEHHFAYLEDLDIGYRARIAGYVNLYEPSALVRHYGSGTSGTRYNSFKVKHAARNSVYVVYKNMPPVQLVLNAPFLAAGFGLKALFFIRKGFGRDYLSGLYAGLLRCGELTRVPAVRKNLPHYMRIQAELYAASVRMAIQKLSG